VWDWIHDILALNVDLIARGGYGGIVLLMAIESSFIPFPSEVVVPPAGYLAATGEMSFAGVMAASVLGSLLGAWFNYGFAIRVGRPFFHRYGRWFLVTPKALDRAEAFFARHGEIGTFVGRLLPGIRQLVSLPAGMARMHLGRFTLFTALGAGTWCAVLFGVGYGVGKAGEAMDLSKVKDQATGIFLLYVLPSLALLVAGYVAWNRGRRNREAAPPPAAPRDGTPGTP
jgi:membrane protein DedA with SNARE-associated domain